MKRALDRSPSGMIARTPGPATWVKGRSPRPAMEALLTVRLLPSVSMRRLVKSRRRGTKPNRAWRAFSMWARPQRHSDGVPP